MKKIILALFASSLLIACGDSSSSNNIDDGPSYNFDLTKTKLTWTAFKTPDKLGVPGTFDEITLRGNSFVINTKSVNTGNEPRDITLVESFFDHLSDPLITGSYGDIVAGVMPITLKMNGQEKTIDFAVTETDSSTVLNGEIDILADFSGNAALEAISLACKELHLDKTWSDVKLQVVQMK